MQTDTDGPVHEAFTYIALKHAQFRFAFSNIVIPGFCMPVKLNASIHMFLGFILLVLLELCS